MKEQEFTSLCLIETQARESRILSRLQDLFDGVIDITSVRVKGKIKRKIGIRSMSGTPFDTKYVPLTLVGNEVIVGEVKKGRKSSDDLVYSSPIMVKSKVKSSMPLMSCATER